ncbi:hypothetical protein TpMuguga_01g00541 [Theileria parva strain Muguga]|uniref:Uncharacterized protein n=1 Tax=Theileria parva TaxID=5875 RepID=Q4N8D0_THEPA|nr:uncharacterized protein TpMuguga_01g00541 [Theileria parva strain Muguga]EAN33778.1 hypothetical protein TpMuguga_01g00541 [Theileria parva strain Muguga]|eukprot:XP_766061.1 hypothetical protein [Theileria parva strain Muguga]
MMNEVIEDIKDLNDDFCVILYDYGTSLVEYYRCLFQLYFNLMSNEISALETNFDLFDKMTWVKLMGGDSEGEFDKNQGSLKSLSDLNDKLGVIQELTRKTIVSNYSYLVKFYETCFRYVEFPNPQNSQEDPNTIEDNETEYKKSQLFTVSKELKKTIMKVEELCLPKAPKSSMQFDKMKFDNLKNFKEFDNENYNWKSVPSKSPQADNI